MHFSLIRSIALLGALAGASFALPQSSGAPDNPLSKRGIGVENGGPSNKENPGGKPAEVKVPRGYAVIIGVGTYQNLDPKDNLQFPERDAESIYDVLISQEGGNFAPENVRKLVGPQATDKNIHDTLETWLPSVAKENDRVLIYFAGHAFLFHGKGYLAPYDVDIHRLEATAYPMETLSRVFGTEIKASWKVLFTDACHSGAITPETSNESLNDELGKLHKDVLSFTASRKQESSFESPNLGGGHGLFTYFLVQALQGQADRNRDGVVTADELIEYVQEHVREYAEAHGRHQSPTESGDFDPMLVLGFNPKQAGIAEDPAQLAEGTLVVESNKDGVEFFLDGKSMGVINKDKALRLPGIAPGPHTVQGAKTGYESDGPRPILVYPGKQTPVSLRIQIAAVHDKAAVEFFKQGLKLYNKGSKADCERATEFFEKALAKDPRYSEAALYLGRTYQVLYKTDLALKYLRIAVAEDPDSADARISYGAMLLDTGNTDEAIRQLTQASGTDPRNSLAHSHLAQAFRMAGAFEKSVDEAKEALRLDSTNAQANLWLGDSLRGLKKFAEAKQAYVEYLRLSDFDAKLPEKLGYYLFSTPFYGAFSKRRATQSAVYFDQRNIGYFGLCECEEKMNNLALAMQYCKRALAYDSTDFYSYSKLGVICLDQYNQKPGREPLLLARSYFEKAISINAGLDESDVARKYIGEIDKRLQQLPPH